MIECTIKDLYDFNKKTNLVDNDYFKVQTINGLKKIETVDITLKDSIKIEILTEKNKKIKTSQQHLLFNDNTIVVSALKIGDTIDTIDGKEKIKKITIDNNKEDLYDLQVDGEEYYANGIRSHNSTIKQALDLCLFGKTQGKTGKKLSLKKLPNRRNKSLYTGIWFKNNNLDTIQIKRFLEPTNFEMYVNEEPFAERFKKMSEKEREDLIGFSYEVFKSFISLNINDFKNFISLSAEDKKNLLNKLFNLDELDTFLSITKELEKTNQKNYNYYHNLLTNNETQISDYRKTINKIQQSTQQDKGLRMLQIKRELTKQKPIFDNLNLKITEYDDRMKDANIKIKKLADIKVEKEKEQTKNELKIDNINDRLKSYLDGICPICQTDLKDDTHQHQYEELIETISGLNNKNLEIDEYLNKVIVEDMKYRNLNSQEYKEKTEHNNKLNQLKIDLGSLKKEYSYLKDQEDIQLQPINELESTIVELEEKNIEYKKLISEFKKKSETYATLIQLFSGEGIRKNIINNVIKPINKCLGRFLIQLDSQYIAILNDNFDATVYELDTMEIDPETLSKGEDKKINLAIALSYLTLILGLKHTNLLFLDEIFDGIDIDNVDITLKILKDIAVENKLNIICVHHNHMNVERFDRIITTKKTIFSDLEDVNLR